MPDIPAHVATHKLNVRVRPKAFYNALDVQRMFGLPHHGTVNLWVRKGLLPAIEIPGSRALRFRHDVVVAFAQRHGLELIGLIGDGAELVMLDPAEVEEGRKKLRAAPVPKSHPTLPERPVYRVNEIAKLLRVGTLTVQKWFDAGLLGGYRADGPRGYRLIPLGCLEAFLNSQGLSPDILNQRKKHEPCTTETQPRPADS